MLDTKLERSLKENLYNTAKNYLQRAEDIKNMNDKQINKSDDKKSIKSNVPETQANKSDDLEKSDPETLDMIKRFESWFQIIYLAVVCIVTFIVL